MLAPFRMGRREQRGPLCITDSGYWKYFSKLVHGAFRNNRTTNLLTHPRWTSNCEIIGGFQLLVRNKLFPSFNCRFFCIVL